MSTRFSSFNFALALVVGGAAIVGCGSSSSPTAKTLDTHRVAVAIQQSIRTKTGLIANVQCPLGIPQKTGVRFVCTAVTKKGTTKFVVTETNALGYVTYVGV